MKIRNIAFFGIMASILTVAGANAAIATNATKIASKQYVDAKDTATLDAAAADATTKANAAQAAAEATAAADATTKAGTAETNAKAYTDTKIGALDNTITATDGKPFTSIIEADGVVSATTGTITTAAFDSNTLKTIVNDQSTDAQLPTAKAVFDAVNTANTAINGLNLASTGTAALPVITVSQTNGQVSATAGQITSAAIEANSLAKSSDVDISANGGDDSLLVTEGGLKKVVTDLDAIGVDGSTDGRPVVKVSQADGVVDAQLGQVDTAGIKDDAVTKAKIQDGAVTTQKIQDLAVDSSKLADDAVVSAKIQDGAILNADINAAAGIEYSKMQKDLTDINTDAATACSATDPCVVTYLGNGNYNYTKFEYADPALTNTPAGN